MDTPKIDFHAAKMQYDLVSYVETVDGLTPVRHTGSRHWYLCPFHSERTASFVINVREGTWHCFGACNCGGDIFDYIQMRQFGSIQRGKVDRIREGKHWRLDHNDQRLQAYHILTGASPAEFKPRAQALGPEREKHDPTMDDVLFYRRYRQQAVAYFAHRGITEASVDRCLLGTQPEYAWGYEFKSEKLRRDKPVWFKGQRHTIPYLAGTNVRCINKRRDDVWAREQLERQDPELLYEIRLDMALHSQEIAAKNCAYTSYASPDAVSDKDLLDACYGPRFHKDGEFPIYNVNRLYTTDDTGELLIADGKPYVAQLDTCLIVEGEADCIAAEQCGFPAVAAKARQFIRAGDKVLKGESLRQYFRYPFSGTRTPVIVADNDDAGDQYARGMLDILGRGMIARLPDGFKDVNDLVIAGRLECWLYDRYGIPPSRSAITNNRSTGW